MLTLAFVIAVALAFDFTNGFHDAANAVATSIATRSIAPRLAVILAGLLNFAGAFVSLKVASTIGKGIIQPGEITLRILLAGLTGAIVWNLLTWWLGLPSSSSHALVGAIAGAAVVSSGKLDIVQWSGVYHKIAVPSVIAPLLGFAFAAILVVLLGGPVWRVLSRRPSVPRGMQLASAGFVAFTHGTNDAQKTMGVIALALLAGGQIQTFEVPDWVILSSALAMALGTYVGGWRIIRTLGSRLSTLDLRSGTAAQTAAGFVLFATAQHGYPVSTTQTVTGSVLGSGAGERFRATHWSVAGRIGIAWVTTIPASACAGALCAMLLKLPGGIEALAAVAVAVIVLAWRRRSLLLASRWDAGIDEPALPAPATAPPAAVAA